MLKQIRDDQFAVWEIGMNQRGEIAALARLASADAPSLPKSDSRNRVYAGSREAMPGEKGASGRNADPSALLFEARLLSSVASSISAHALRVTRRDREGADSRH